MSIVFNCPKCSQPLTVGDEHARSQVRCPACAATVTVPGPVRAEPLEAIPLAEPVPESPPRPRSRPPFDEDEPPRRRPLRFDDDEDDYSVRSRRIHRSLRTGDWGRAASALMLNFVASWFHIAAYVVVGIGILAMLDNTSTKPSSSDGPFTAFLLLGGCVVFVAWLLSLIGYGIGIGTPGKNGESGLAITALIVGGLVLLLAFVLGMQFMELGSAQERMRPNQRGPTPNLSSIRETIQVVSIMLALLEVARLTLFAFYVWAIGKSLAKPPVATAGITLGVTLPLVLGGIFIINLMLAATLGRNPDRLWMVVSVYLIEMLVLVGIMLWYALVLWSARKAVELYLRASE
jgi:hypothetical protein